MSFNWKAFAASFLDKQTEGIKERKEEAKTFEEEEKEKANRNALLVSQRNALAQDAAQIGQAAMNLGATKEQVIAAMSSGSVGVKQFYEKLLKAANQKGVKTLGPSDIDAIIDLPEVFEVNPEYIDGSLLDFAKQTYGAQLRPDMQKAPIQTSDSMLAQLFGVDAMSQAKKRLQDTEYVGGMSIADINELARQSDYNSLFGEIGVNFFDKEFYGPQAASTLLKDVTDEAARSEVSSLTKARVEKAIKDLNVAQNPTDGSEPTRTDETVDSVTSEATQLSIRLELEPIIQTALDMYGTTGILDHEPTLKLIRETMGEEYLQEQIELIRGSENTTDTTDTLSDREENLGSAEAIRTGMDEAEARTQAGVFEQETEQPVREEEETTQTETSDTETKKTALLAKTFPTRESQRGLAAKGIWDRKYEGKVDAQGKAIIAPPRPDEGGEKTKEIEVTTGAFESLQFGTGKMKKVTEAEYWDATYGDTHDPVTGLPLGIDELLED